ncbi:universal stress protein [Labilithrix luteola]|nr:universal stress protein [Labilithrix luteola]
MKLLLVCLDASERAPFVLSQAIDLAKASKAKLRLFRAVGVPPELPKELYTLSPNALPDVLLKGATEQLTELAKQVPAELLDGVDTHLGVSWDAICNAARSYNADLIVIGSHGFSGLDRVLGTTAARVVNHADRSVLVVRAKSI